MVKKALTTIIILQILVLISLGCLVYYLYKVRVIEKINYTDVRTDITDNTIPKEKAESLTFDSLIKKKENPDFKESFLINSSTDSHSGSTLIQPAYKIVDNTIVKNTDLAPNSIPQFYVDANSKNIDDTSIANLIVLTVKQDSLKEIDIDVSITNKVENIEKVIKNIVSSLTPTEIKINLGLPIKWSDNIDYGYMAIISRFYKSNASIEVLNNLCNKFRIDSYGYTTINSSSAGPITKPDIAQDTIKYYIYKGISSNKIDLVINNTGYMWANRSYTDNYLFNYVLADQQVVILNNKDVNNYLSKPEFSILKNFDNGENLGVLQKDGNINYIVYPRLTLLTSLVDIAKGYGLNGFIYKNF